MPTINLNAKPFDKKIQQKFEILLLLLTWTISIDMYTFLPLQEFTML